eukprot:scaffold133_cov257-Pinguiococcus_pyrenoidosus.AAC.28
MAGLAPEWALRRGFILRALRSCGDPAGHESGFAARPSSHAGDSSTSTSWPSPLVLAAEAQPARRSGLRAGAMPAERQTGPHAPSRVPSRRKSRDQSPARLAASRPEARRAAPRIQEQQQELPPSVDGHSPPHRLSSFSACEICCSGSRAAFFPADPDGLPFEKPFGVASCASLPPFESAPGGVAAARGPVLSFSASAALLAPCFARPLDFVATAEALPFAPALTPAPLLGDGAVGSLTRCFDSCSRSSRSPAAIWRRSRSLWTCISCVAFAMVRRSSCVFSTEDLNTSRLQ